MKIMSRFIMPCAAMPTACTIAKTGKYDGISIGLSHHACPSAFVVDPDKPMDVPKLALEVERKEAFEAIKLATITGVETRVPQAVPPGTSEAGVGITERLLVDLPSKDYFLKNLYRQHYPGEDEFGDPPWAQQERGTLPTPKPRAEPRAHAPKAAPRGQGRRACALQGLSKITA